MKIISPEKNAWWGRSPSKSKKRYKKKDDLYDEEGDDII